MERMDIQRFDIVLIVLGVMAGVAVMWFFVAPSWWAVLVGVVCGAAGGTIAAIQLRTTKPTRAR